MTDRELLELAAKAALIEYGGYDPKRGLLLYYEHPAEPSAWNPLEDDGDALRLAVDLRLACDFSEDDIDVITWSGESGAITGEADNGDRPSCARRAIVRAAAAMAPKGAS